MSTEEYVEAPWRPPSGAWLLEQAKVTEVVPENVLRALWQRYDADHNGVLDESELEAGGGGSVPLHMVMSPNTIPLSMVMSPKCA